MAYEDNTVAELKDLLKERGLPVSGKKADLISRLVDADSNETRDESSDDNEIVENTTEDEDLQEGEVQDEEDEFYEEGDFEEWDEIHTARQKPVLDEETKSALQLRSEQKGNDSKMRKNRKYRSPMARVGYGKVASARDLHPSGFREVMVHKSEQLEGLDPERQAVRIGASVGNRKRSRIHERADELGLRILNRRQINRKGDL